MSGECNLQLLHELKENNYDGIYNQNVYCHNNVWNYLYLVLQFYEIKKCLTTPVSYSNFGQNI